MNFINRVMRSFRNQGFANKGFESYYGSIVRKQDGFGPTADEARRDFQAAKSPIRPGGIF